MQTMLVQLAAWAVLAAPPAAAPESRVIAEGPWSKPVADARGFAVRGRLVMAEKLVHAERREIAVFVELQEAADFIGPSLRLFCEMSKTDFRPEHQGGLTCEFRDKAGKVLESTGFPFGGATPRAQWVTVPKDGSIRLRATPFGIHRPGAMAICPGLSGMWIINDDDGGEYSLSGKFGIAPEKQEMEDDNETHVWRGTIELPAMKIVNKPAK